MQSAYLLLPSGARIVPLRPVTYLITGRGPNVEQLQRGWALQAVVECLQIHQQQQWVKHCAGFQGKSIARAVESRVIQALRDEGFALISDHDARTNRSPHVA